MVFGRKHQDEAPVEDLNGTIPNVDPYTGRHTKGTGLMSKITGHANTNTNTRTGTGTLSGVDPNYTSSSAPGGAMSATGGPNHLGTNQAYDTYDTQGTTNTGVGGTHMPGNTHGVTTTGTTGAGMTGHHQVVGHDPVHPEKVYTADPNTGLRDPYPHTTAGASMGDAGVGTGTAHAPGAVGAGTGFANEGPNAMPNVAPTSSLATNSTTHSGGSGKSLTGKIQSAAGTVLHSSTLKAKGEEKQHEAEALRMQGAEISEAERLEAEARQRRDRAVAAGAHPDHKHLGGVVPPREQQAY